jgi:manganese transport protein
LIVLTASAAFYDTHTPWNTTDQIVEQLRPTLGRASGIAFAWGLFGAGLTSSITAPIATAYAICGSLGWQTRPSSPAFRAIAISVIVIGASLAIYWGSSPTATILFAQVANGLLLPIVAIFLLHTVQRTGVAGSDGIKTVGLIAAWLVTCLVAVLGAWRVVSALTSL